MISSFISYASSCSSRYVSRSLIYPWEPGIWANIVCQAKVEWEKKGFSMLLLYWLCMYFCFLGFFFRQKLLGFSVFYSSSFYLFCSSTCLDLSSIYMLIYILFCMFHVSKKSIFLYMVVYSQCPFFYISSKRIQRYKL